MPQEIHSRFFAMLGLSLGALYGFIFSIWTPPTTAIITDLYKPIMWAVSILSFFVLQYSLGVILHKPNISREIYFGVFLIPITYTASVLTISIPNFLLTIISVEVPALVLFITSFYIVSPFIIFFAGFDTKALDNAEIPAETVFSYNIQHSTEGGRLELLTRMMHGMGFETSLKDVRDDKSGLIICRKKKLRIGVFYKLEDHVLTATFVPFRIENDVVKKVENLDLTIDLKAQINGMLYAWMQHSLILRFNEAPPDLQLGFEKVSEGLGPLKTPLASHIRETIVSFPKNHPYQFALLTTGSVIIFNIMLFILGKLVFR